MDLKFYHYVRKAEKELKEKYNLKDFGIYMPDTEMSLFSLVFQGNENDPTLVKSVIENFVNILKAKGYDYKLKSETLNPIMIFDVDEYGNLIRETAKNYYDVIKN